MATAAENPRPTVWPAPGRAKRLAALAGVLVACGSLRIWLVANTEVIGRDGMGLVAAARRFDRDAGEEIREGTVHPGYPACLAGVRRVLTAFGADAEAVWLWDLSGQIVSVAAALAATLGLWYFAGSVLPWPAGALGVLLISLTRKWSALGADVLGDALAVCFQVWAAVLALAAARALRARRKGALAWAAGVGLCAAAGYLVRPEAIVVGAIAVSLWLTNIFRKQAPVRLSLAAVLVAAATIAACTGPYMLAIGAFSNRASIQHYVAPAPPRAAAVAGPLAEVPGGGSSAHQLIDQFTIAQHLVVSFLAAVCLATWLAGRVPRVRVPDRVRVFPSPDGAILMFAAVVLSAGPLMHHAAAHKLSHRYLMFQAVLLSPLAGAGLVILGRWLQTGAARVGRSAWQGRLVSTLGAGVVVAVLAVHALRPLHVSKGNFRDAGAYVRSVTTGDDYVAATERWILYYSDRPGWFILPQYITKQGALLGFLRNWGVTHFVFCHHANPKEGESLVDLDTPRLVRLRTFPPDQAKGTTIVVYRVVRDGWEGTRIGRE